jgi:hypothetical protein
MKVEGSPKEIRDLFLNKGFQSEEYFLKMPRTRWFVLPCALFAFIVILLFLLKADHFLTPLLVLVGIGLSGWSLVVLQLIHKNGFATVVLAIFMLALLSVAAGLKSPGIALESLQRFFTQSSP